MIRKKQMIAMILCLAFVFSLCACGNNADNSSSGSTYSAVKENNRDLTEAETKLNLKNNSDQEWSYSSDAGAWTLSVVSAVLNPELPDQQGVSVCVPGAYVKGIDTNSDGSADVTADNYSDAVKGSLVIDYDASVTSTNGQSYTAAKAPVILNTGAAGYGSSNNTAASTTYAKEGYINVSCGNRGKQDTATDSDGKSYYTGDAPLCLVDQKNAARFVKYNILLGNLPGSMDYFVSTGGSGGGAHAAMFAATSNNPDFYDYEIEAGAVGIIKNDDGSYSSSVVIDGKEYALSDGAWGCIAYSAITSLYEADMAMAFEYFLDADYSFGSDFQSKLAELLAAEYKDYINGKNLTVKESAVGLDINGDGNKEDEIKLTIEYDKEKYPDTNGYGGTYLDFYLAEFISNLQWYIDNLDYAENWTWFDSDGKALSDTDVAAMTTADKAQAFIEGRYTKGSSGSDGGPGGGMQGGSGSGTPGDGNGPGGDMGTPPDRQSSNSDDSNSSRSLGNSEVAANSSGDTMDVGTPNAGSTQSASGSKDSSNYTNFEEMLKSYKTDIAAVQAGDKYGNNIVNLYNPLNYIGNDDTENPTWTRIVMGASEGDMSMFSSLNMQIAWLNAGVDSTVEWQWDGGHVPSEVLGNSFALCVDEMYGKHVDGAKSITKAAAEKQTANGDSDKASGTSISSWVSYKDEAVSFTLADAASYRTSGASKAIPGFDVIDYGQEDYVFGSATADARHWDEHLLKVLETNADTLSPLFNK